MKRIAIMGCSGSGKSTLARALGAALDLPVHHLDVYHWQPGWQEPDFAVFTAQVQNIVASDRWIIDGGYSQTDPEELRLSRADVLILYDRSAWLCLLRVIRRVFKYRNKTRPDMGDGCNEKVDWEFLAYIWNYKKSAWPRILERAERNNTPMIILRKDPNIGELVTELRCLAAGRTSPANP